MSVSARVTSLDPTSVLVGAAGLMHHENDSLQGGYAYMFAVPLPASGGRAAAAAAAAANLDSAAAVAVPDQRA